MTVHEHPSFLALDRLHLGGESSAQAEHASSCGVCRGHLEQLSEAVPDARFVALQRAIAAERRARWSWLGGLGAVAAAACALLLFVALRPSGSVVDESAYVGAKGFRSVWIYVKHGLETELWDGKKPIHPGDRLRLKIDPGSYRHVQIYSLDANDQASLLFESALTPGQNLTLPDAWEVDEAQASERLFVVFGQQSVEPAWEDWLNGKADPNIAVLPFVLSKLPDAGSPNP